MPIDPTAFWKRVHLGEDTFLELAEVRLGKRDVAAPKRSDLADGFAAFANSGGGWFVLGVRDDRTHQGLTPEQLDSVAEMVTEICSDGIQPPLDFSARVERGHRGGEGLEVEMRTADNGGSMIIPNGTGRLPGIKGRLNPIWTIWTGAISTPTT